MNTLKYNLSLSYRFIFLTVTFLSLIATAMPSQAQAWPNRAVRIIVPYPPGGIGDTVTRAIAQGLSEQFGQPFVIDNKPGASQKIGAEMVAKSPADGYTLFLGSVTSLAINVNSQKKCLMTLSGIFPLCPWLFSHRSI